ncbi:MAG TPA: YegS/Rv2252/BmrU family lipid kinase [Flavisolibacter sp.]|jgi:YegS/Rv2252/BmrU family lipid kinase|nr:YegS/Rv2252/BmrU family lipid kinase [Flavisolibacter sp.]
MIRRFIYIVNPISGTRSKQSIKELIAAKTKAAGFEFEIFPSVANADYSFLHDTIKQQKITDVVIAGGDGTINQVINHLRKFPVQFGILPFGSGNGLAFSAGIPKNTEKALDIILKGNGQWTDAFLINDSFACMLVGLGFDAQVAHDFANDPKRGLATYIKQTIKNFFSAKTYPFTIKLQGRELRTDAFFISVANSNQFGNNFKIAPKASLTDGLLDIVIMTKQSKLSMLWQAALQVGGFHQVERVSLLDEKASLLYFQTEALSISNPKKAPMHIDGDPVETEKKLEIQLLKNCFRLVYP